MKNSWKLAATAFSAAALLGGLHGAAQAQLVTFTLGNLPTAETPTVNVSGTNYYVGRYQATLGNGPNAPTVNVFCVDFNQHISAKDTYPADIDYGLTAGSGGLDPTTTPPNSYYTGGLASALNGNDYYKAGGGGGALSAQSRADEAAYLADTYLSPSLGSTVDGSTFTAMDLSAIQISIWDIIQDGADGIANGQIKVDSSYLSLVNFYEGKAAGFANTGSASSDWIQAPRNSSDPSNHSQEFVFDGTPLHTTGSPVPEPGPLAMLASLGAAVGGLLLKRLRVRQTA